MAIFDIQTLRPWIVVHFSRSSGPGGQNVNKVNTRVTLLFDFQACPVLSDLYKQRIRMRLRTRLSADRRLRVVRHRERTQARNRAAAEHQLVELLDVVSRLNKTRKPTRPTLGSVKRRLDEKRRRGDLKKQRRGGANE